MATCDKLKGEHPQYKEGADSLHTRADLINASSHFVSVVPAESTRQGTNLVFLLLYFTV